jgi:hypothetical protein
MSIPRTTIEESRQARNVKVKALLRENRSDLKAARQEERVGRKAAYAEELAKRPCWELHFPCLGCGRLLRAAWLPAECPECGRVQPGETSA